MGENGDLWWVGVLMSLAASVGSVLGMALQKIGHQRNQLLPDHERKSFLEMPYTWIGVAVMVLIPAPLDVGALLFARYSVLAPFSGFTLVLNALTAPFLLGERVEYVDYISSALICFGTGITTIYGSHYAKAYDVPRLYEIYTSKKCLIYTTVGGGGSSIVACLLWQLLRKKHGASRHASSSSEKTDIEMEGLTAHYGNGEVSNGQIGVACFEGDVATRNVHNTRKAVTSRKGNDWVPLLLAYVNGLAGSTQQICVKTLIELTKTTLAVTEEEYEYSGEPGNDDIYEAGSRKDGGGDSDHKNENSKNQFQFGLTYFLLFVAAVSVLLQFRLLNYGLEHYNAITYVPRYSACFILTGILGGWFYLGDADELPAPDILMFFCGGAVTVCGVLLLQLRPVRNQSVVSAMEATPTSLSDPCKNHPREAAPRK